MIATLNALLPKENSQVPSAATAGWNADIAARVAMDSRLQAINFPGSLQSDVDALVAADVAVESIEGTLAVNTDSVTNYNSIFNTL
jgi:hypothetical protein